MTTQLQNRRRRCGDVGDSTGNPPDRTWRILGLLLFVGAAVPYRFWLSGSPTGSISTLDVVILIAAFVLGMRVLARKPFRIGDPTFLLLLAIPMLINTASLAWTDDISATVRIEVSYIEALVAYVVVLNVLGNRSLAFQIRMSALFVGVLLLGGVLSWARVPGFGLASALSEVSGNVARFSTRFGNPFLGPSNFLAATLLPFVFVFLVGWTNMRQRRWFAMALITVLGIAMTLSRSAVIVLSLGVLVLLIGGVARMSKGLRRVVLALGLAFVGGVLIVAAFLTVGKDLYPAFSDNITTRLDTRGFDDRRELLEEARTSIEESPIFGTGGGTSIGDVGEGERQYVHNTYVQQIVWYGIPLGIASALSILALLWLLPGPSSATGDRERIGLRLIKIAALSMLLSLLFEPTNEGVVGKIIIAMTWGVLVSMACRLAHNKRESTPVESDERLPSPTR